MQHRRRSKRIAALSNSSCTSLTGSILVRGQQSSSKRVRNRTRSSKNFQDFDFEVENQTFSSPHFPHDHVKKRVSFSPSSIVVDGIGFYSEEPLAKPQENGAIRTNTHLKDVVFSDETMTAAEVAALTGTENLLTDDDVFEGDSEPDDVGEGSRRRYRYGRYEDSLYVADYTIHEDYIMSTQSWIALMFIIVAVVFLAFTYFFPQLFVVKIDHQKDDYAFHWKEDKGIFILAFLGCLLSASLIGCGCGCFSWMVTYFDSLEPGINPPTPLSPRPLKTSSGHTYHFGYVMSLLNGFAMFMATVWWMRDTYLIA